MSRATYGAHRPVQQSLMRCNQYFQCYSIKVMEEEEHMGPGHVWRNCSLKRSVSSRFISWNWLSFVSEERKSVPCDEGLDKSWVFFFFCKWLKACGSGLCVWNSQSPSNKRGIKCNNTVCCAVKSVGPKQQRCNCLHVGNNDALPPYRST